MYKGNRNGYFPYECSRRPEDTRQAEEDYEGYVYVHTEGHNMPNTKIRRGGLQFSRLLGPPVHHGVPSL